MKESNNYKMAGIETPCVVWLSRLDLNKVMRPRLGRATIPTHENRTVFHDTEVRLFFCNRSSDLEEEIVLYNEDFRTLTNEEHEIFGDHDAFEYTYEWLYIESIILLVLSKLFLLWARLNDTIGRYIE